MKVKVYSHYHANYTVMLVNIQTRLSCPTVGEEGVVIT